MAHTIFYIWPKSAQCYLLSFFEPHLKLTNQYVRHKFNIFYFKKFIIEKFLLTAAFSISRQKQSNSYNYPLHFTHEKNFVISTWDVLSNPWNGQN